MKCDYGIKLIQDIIRIEEAIFLIDRVLETYKEINTDFYWLPIGLSSSKSELLKILKGLKMVLENENGKNRNT
jgi:hypothetical protein